MGQIDLARATIRIKDGFTVAGAVNNVSGYAASGNITTVTVDGFAVALPAGSELTFAGDNTVYKIISSVGGATPTSITFTPKLAVDLTDNQVVTVGPNFVEAVIGEGNLTYEEKRAFEYVRNKRKISFVRTGDEQPMDVSLDAIWEYLSSVSGESPTIEDALKQENQASAWVTSGADPCEPYCVDISIDYVPPCIGANKSERITLKEYRWESLNHDLKAGTIATKGMCKIVSPTKERY